MNAPLTGSTALALQLAAVTRENAELKAKLDEAIRIERRHVREWLNACRDWEEKQAEAVKFRGELERHNEALEAERDALLVRIAELEAGK